MGYGPYPTEPSPLFTETSCAATPTLPPTATGLSKMACMPKMADWGGLMIGVPKSDPKTPPLLIVKVPPSMSSMASSFFRA